MSTLRAASVRMRGTTELKWVCLLAQLPRGVLDRLGPDLVGAFPLDIPQMAQRFDDDVIHGISLLPDVDRLPGLSGLTPELSERRLVPVLGRVVLDPRVVVG